ncbi:hypothetical protein TIFTF001_028025 [Ficus carica]|uniref:Uncharacterized protein n=1 Tax=Ficus carica TaxID=3494 RepID=A0AA88DP58_FICCA|nr:hypothetical protein TIFTF001_028025 [Ficus carica]
MACYAYMPPPVVTNYAGYLVTPAVVPVHGGGHNRPDGVTDKLSSFIKGATVGKLVHEALVFVAGKVVLGHDLSFENSYTEIFKH